MRKLFFFLLTVVSSFFLFGWIVFSFFFFPNFYLSLCNFIPFPIGGSLIGHIGITWDAGAEFKANSN